jgi:hypothetical protein
MVQFIFSVASVSVAQHALRSAHVFPLLPAPPVPVPAHENSSLMQFVAAQVPKAVLAVWQALDGVQLPLQVWSQLQAVKHWL